MNRKVKGVDV